MTQTPPQTPQGSWLREGPLTGFALPQGRFARVFGWVLARPNPEQDDAFRSLEPQADEHVLEVGHGPGILLAKIARTGSRVYGVDPSEPMVRMARKRLGKVTDSATIRTGTAERTGFDDQSFHAAVSVNNVPLWSDLTAGFRELHRVLRPQGRLVVAWHGGRNPTFVGRRLVLPDDVLDRILAELRSVFGNGEREQLEHVEVFRAVR